MIFLAVWIVFVITMMQEISCTIMYDITLYFLSKSKIIKINWKIENRIKEKEK